MEYQEIENLLGNTINTVQKFSSAKRVEVYDQSDGAYSTSKQIRFKTSML